MIPQPRCGAHRGDPFPGDPLQACVLLPGHPGHHETEAGTLWARTEDVDVPVVAPKAWKDCAPAAHDEVLQGLRMLRNATAQARARYAARGFAKAATYAAKVEAYEAAIAALESLSKGPAEPSGGAP
jgi:hypothetical protein